MDVFPKKEFCEDVINELMKSSADYAELFFEHSPSKGFSFIDSKPDNVSAGICHGFGLRLLHENRTIYLYSSDMSIENVRRLAKKAKSLVSSSDKAADIRLNESKALMDERVIASASVPDIHKLDFLAAMDSQVRCVSNLITQVSLNYSEKERSILVCNSDGAFAFDTQPYTRVLVNAVAKDENSQQSFYSAPGVLGGYEFIKQMQESGKANELAIDTAESALRMLSATYPKSGSYPVVIGAKGGVILHEACGHALEASSVADNNSVLAGKLGERIASECVSVYDDGTMPGLYGSISIDDEGTPTEKTLLIESGILKSYMVDKLGSMKMNHRITGSARRENYKYAPTSRMRNTYIDEGQSEFEELFEGIKFGLYAKKLGGGQVDPATTEFNFGVTEGYLIEDGKISKPVRGAMLIGKGDEVLMNIEKVGRGLELVPGVCGSISGGVPVTDGQPPIKVRSMTVGGR